MLIYTNNIKRKLQFRDELTLLFTKILCIWLKILIVDAVTVPTTTYVVFQELTQYRKIKKHFNAV